MKKYLMILLAVACFGLSANATVFRSKQSVCGKDGGQLIFKSDGSVEVWNNGVYAGEGTYTIEENIIIMSFENGKMRLSANHNGQTLNNVSFRGDTYYRCNR